MAATGLVNNSILMEKGMTANACLKETVPLKILDHCKWLPAKNDGTTQMYGCKCSFEIKICLK